MRAADGTVVCRVEMEDESWEEDVANARLIVAAVNALGEVHASGNGDARYPAMWERDVTDTLVNLEPQGGA